MSAKIIADELTRKGFKTNQTNIESWLVSDDVIEQMKESMLAYSSENHLLWSSEPTNFVQGKIAAQKDRLIKIIQQTDLVKAVCIPDEDIDECYYLQADITQAWQSIPPISDPLIHAIVQFGKNATDNKTLAVRQIFKNLECSKKLLFLLIMQDKEVSRLALKPTFGTSEGIRQTLSEPIDQELWDEEMQMLSEFASNKADAPELDELFLAEIGTTREEYTASEPIVNAVDESRTATLTF